MKTDTTAQSVRSIEVKTAAYALVREIRDAFPEQTFFILWDQPNGAEIFGFIGKSLDDKVSFFQFPSGKDVIRTRDLPEPYSKVAFDLACHACRQNNLTLQLPDADITFTQLIKEELV